MPFNSGTWVHDALDSSPPHKMPMPFNSRNVCSSRVKRPGWQYLAGLTRWFFAMTMKSVGVAANEMVKVGRCRLTVSKPLLKAPLVPALEATIGSNTFKLCFQIQLAPLHQGGGPPVPRDPRSAGGRPRARAGGPRALHPDLHGRLPARDDRARHSRHDDAAALRHLLGHGCGGGAAGRQGLTPVLI